MFPLKLLKQRYDQHSLFLGKTTSNPKNQPKPRHCQDLKEAGDSGIGLRTVYPYDDQSIGVEVLCDQDTAGGGWTVIQQRKYIEGATSVNFYRTWAEYQGSFGNIDPDGEFWMGLDLIHHLTSNLGLQVIIKLRYRLNRTACAHSLL